ncbi:hypothetical protein Z043_103434 [Scleropages formosus]|uniref:Uncharacterized protein n=1 Tax=Scleropages formosus TaxID=113540 RepID=A0A0P7V4M9_SCLFO|nr:hypothetical protein Z043_103434 [Scleropages formosus]
MSEFTDKASVTLVKYKGDYVSTETNFMHKMAEGTLEETTVVCSMPALEKPSPPITIALMMKASMMQNFVVFFKQPIRMLLFKMETIFHVSNNNAGKINLDSSPATITNSYFDHHMTNGQCGSRCTVAEVNPNSVKFYSKPLSTIHQTNAFKEDDFIVTSLRYSDNETTISNYMTQNMHKSGEALDEVYNTLCRKFPQHFVAMRICMVMTFLSMEALSFHRSAMQGIKLGSITTSIAVVLDTWRVTSLLKMDIKTKIKSTFNLVLDAKTSEETGRAEVPVNIPDGFHKAFKATTLAFITEQQGSEQYKTI